MPKGSRQVPWARAMASLKSAAVSSSQWTDGLFCGEGDCARMVETQSTLRESSNDWRTCPPLLVLGPQLSTNSSGVRNVGAVSGRGKKWGRHESRHVECERHSGARFPGPSVAGARATEI